MYRANLVRNPLIISFFQSLLIVANGLAAQTAVAAPQVETLQNLDGESANVVPVSGETGWVSLFDGKSLWGWKAESAANWEVREEAIWADQGLPGLLRTTSQWDDFELQLEFTAGPNTNSGVFLLTSPRPQAPDVDCYEVNIINAAQHPFPTGSLVARQVGRPGPELVWQDWHQLRVVSQAGQLQISIDGLLVNDYRDPKPLGRGYIGLQFNGGPVGFRHIRLRPLNTFELGGPGGWGQWLDTQLREGRAEVDSQGVLKLQGGPGAWESREAFGDFILTATARTRDDEVNSGLFFRCVPREFLNGYECQIQHARKGPDSREPLDGGTGGIFRRQEAREIYSRGGEWFELTLAVSGPHIATWINGQAVCDWTDERPEDPNPRRGKRLAAGTLAIQLHDPDTEIEFREIRIRELNPRNR